MLEIKTDNGTSLVLFPDTTIPLTITSPPFSDVGSHSYDIALPDCDINNAALGYPKRVSRDVEFDISVKIYVDGLPLSSGNLRIISTENGIINTYFLPLDGNFIDQASKTMLPDINFGSDINIGASLATRIYYINDAISKDLDDTIYSDQLSFNFPMIYAPDFTQDNGYLKYINFYDMSGETITENVITSDITSDNVNCVVPFFYLVWIFRKLINHFSLNYSGSFFTAAIFKNILVLNNYNLKGSDKAWFVRANYSTSIAFDMSDITYATPLTAWGDIPFDDDSTAPNEDDDDVFSLVNYRYKVGQRGLHKFFVKFSIFSDYVSDVDIIVSIYDHNTNTILSSWADYTINSGSNDVEFNDLIYLDNTYIDKYLSFIINIRGAYSGPTVTLSNIECIISNNSVLNLNVFTQYISPANHMPNMTVLNYLDQVCDYLGLAWFYDDSKKNISILPYSELFQNATTIDITDLVNSDYNIIEFKKNKINFAANLENLILDSYTLEGTYDTLDDAPDSDTFPGQIIKVLNSGIIFISQYNEDTDIWEWIKLDDNTQPYELGDDDSELLELKPSVAPAAMHKYNATINMPESKMVDVNSGSNGNVSSDIQLIQYHGKQIGPYAGKYYPAASILRWDKDYSDITGFDLTPEWIANNNYSAYFNHLIATNRTLELTLNASFAQITGLKLWNKYKIGSMIGFITEINTILSNDGAYNTTIKFMPLL
jgi:hypothetical protein